MYKFINRDEGSSVYTAVSDVLLGRPNQQWARINRNSERFNLILAERNRAPYARLGRHSGLPQAINYYRGSSKHLCRKISLVRTVRSIADVKGLIPWMPLSFIIVPTSLTRLSDNQENNLKSTSCKDERENFLEAYKSCNSSIKRNIWIGKSNAGAKGEKIFISSSAEEMLELIDGENQTYVIQKYIEDPLLLDGQRKFDIRVWVLLDHVYNIKVFSEGVLRTSSEPYDVDNLSNMTSHLTNHCVQEAHSQNFGKYEKGNEMFFDEFSRFLKRRDGIAFKETILPQIHSVVRECLMGIKEEINTIGLCYHSFQLFGFDFMIDNNYKVWLLEVNGAPASASDLLPSLARQIVASAIDPIFPPSHQNVQSDVQKNDDSLNGEFIQIN